MKVLIENTLVVGINILFVVLAAVVIIALMADQDMKRLAPKSVRIVISLVIAVIVGALFSGSIYRVRCDTNENRLKPDVVAAFKDLKPGKVVKVTLKDEEIPLLNDDFSLECPSECIVYDNAYYFVAKGSDKKNYYIHFLISDKESNSKETLETLLTSQTREYERGVEPHSGLRAPKKHDISPMIRQDKLLELVRRQLKEDSESPDEVTSDGVLLTYFAIFNDIHSFTILGCVDRGKKESSKEAESQEQDAEPMN